MKAILVVALGLLLGACSTSVEHRTPTAPDVVGNVTVKNVTVTAAETVEYAAPDMLKAAVLREIADRNPGARSVNLSLKIESLEVVSGGARFFIGAFGGANTMSVTVAATDEDGRTLADFRVVRESNPGGSGAFFDQKQATVDETAKGIVEALYGPPAG